jgi:hypothetical protein
MSTSKPSILPGVMPDLVHSFKPEHFIVFGLIITSFARLEWLIQITIAGVGNLDFGKILIVTRSMPYSAKRDTLYALMNNLNMPVDHKKHIEDFLDEANKINPLRNNIAHAIWCDGSRPGSIKPMTIIVRGGKGKHLGINDDETDYTVPDLIQITDKLAIINNSYLNFLRAAGYTSSIEEKILEIMTSKTSS